MNVLIGKTGATVEIDEAQLSDATRAFLFAYGVRQWLNDKHASVQIGKDGATGDDVMAVVHDAIARLRAGDLGRQGGGRTSDPVAQEMRKIAVGRANDAIKKLSVDVLRTKLADHGWDFAQATKAKARAAFVAAIVERLLEKHESELRETAKANLAKNAELQVDVEV